MKKAKRSRRKVKLRKPKKPKKPHRAKARRGDRGGMAFDPGYNWTRHKQPEAEVGEAGVIGEGIKIERQFEGLPRPVQTFE